MAAAASAPVHSTPTAGPVLYVAFERRLRYLENGLHRRCRPAPEDSHGSGPFDQFRPPRDQEGQAPLRARRKRRGGVVLRGRARRLLAPSLLAPPGNSKHRRRLGVDRGEFWAPSDSWLDCEASPVRSSQILRSRRRDSSAGSTRNGSSRPSGLSTAWTTRRCRGVATPMLGARSRPGSAVGTPRCLYASSPCRWDFRVPTASPTSPAGSKRG